MAGKSDWLDRGAIGMSVLCLIHCLALPVLFAALPALSRLFSLPESVHLWILVFAVPTSSYALLTGRARHGAAWPIVAGAGGLMLLGLGALPLAGSAAETPVSVVGSLSLALAHIVNWRMRHSVAGAAVQRRE